MASCDCSSLKWLYGWMLKGVEAIEGKRKKRILDKGTGDENPIGPRCHIADKSLWEGNDGSGTWRDERCSSSKDAVADEEILDYKSRVPQRDSWMVRL